MTCPECGTDGSSVTRTLDMGATILRRRLCACGVTWQTKERIDRSSGALVAPLRTNSRGGDLLSYSSPSHCTQSQTRSESRAKTPYSDEFEACWKTYGRKEEKVKAFGRWKIEAKAAGGEAALRDLILAALVWQAPEWARDGWRFAKYFERYLKARKWEDEPLPTFSRRPAAHVETYAERDRRLAHEAAERQRAADGATRAAMARKSAEERKLTPATREELEGLRAAGSAAR